MASDYATEHVKRDGTKVDRYMRWIPGDLQPLFGKRKVLSKLLSDVAGRDLAAKKRALGARDDQLFDDLRKLSADKRAQIIAAGGVDALRDAMTSLEWRVRRHMTLEAILQHLSAPDRELLPEKPGLLTLSGVVQQVTKNQGSDLAALNALEELRPVVLQAAPAAAFTFDALYDLWRAKGCKRTRVHIRTRDLLKTHFGDIDYRHITKAKMHEFRKWLPLQGIGPHSQGAIMNAVRGMLSAAVDDGAIEDNPAHGVKVAGLKKGTRDHFTGSQLRSILAKAESTKFGGKRHIEVMWMLRLAIYSGLRINEIAQLRKDDVGEANGVAFLHIREGAGQSLKNGAARRVPLHPACADFLAYAQAARTDFVFGAFPYNKDNGRAYWVISNFGAFKRDVCEITTKTTLHSLRTSFHRAMSDARLHGDAQRFLVGHAGKDVHDKTYNNTQGLGLLAEEIARVNPLAIED